jgi:nitroreductase
VTRDTVPRAVLDTLAKAATDEGVQLQVLHAEQVDDLAVAVANAASVDAGDPAIQDELDRWTAGHRGEGTGIPDGAIPERPPQTNVPGRAFARSGTLPIRGDHDRTAAYAILYGDTDDPAGWLRAGEALSAVWLTAVERGVGVLPISEAVEMPASRQTLRRTLSFFGWPYLAMRLGIPDPDRPGPPHTPRLPTEKTVEITHKPDQA